MYTLVSAASKSNWVRSTRFAEDIRRSLGTTGQKSIPSTYLYDQLGSVLFDAITLLDEYGLTRADEDLLRTHAPEIAARAGSGVVVIELGSGSGSKTRNVLSALGGKPVYYPIDVAAAALGRCASDLAAVADVRPIEATYLDGLRQVMAEVGSAQAVLLMFLGSTIGNFDSDSAAEFLLQLRRCLRPNDRFLLGADLVKPVDQMLVAYDDPAGVTAAFNKNVLSRINRELDADFDLRSFAHEARWNEREQRIEMHLRSLRSQSVRVSRAGNLELRFEAGETIWTESSHKFTTARLNAMCIAAGFEPEVFWTHSGWPFAECLWKSA